MNAPFDPEETHGGSEHEDDPFGDNSMTWGAAEPEFDRMFRERIGQPTTLPTPPYAFERVLLAGRRRRARKVWAASAAAALVVMAGTAGTTVALRDTSSNGGVVGPAASRTGPSPTRSAAPSPSASPSSSPTATVTKPPTTAATSSAPADSGASPSTAATTPQCHSDDLQLTVTLQPGGTSGTDAVLIVLRNNSPHTCTTHGYPGLQTETENEQLQSTTTTRVDRSAVATLTIGAGQYFSTVATFTTVASGATATPGAGCGAPSYYLAVIPPNEQSQIAATIEGGPVTVCGNGEFKSGPLVMGQNG